MRGLGAKNAMIMWWSLDVETKEDVSNSMQHEYLQMQLRQRRLFKIMINCVTLASSIIALFA